MSKFAGESVLLPCYGSRGLIIEKSVCFSLIFFCHGWGRIVSFHANSLLWRVPWLLPHIVSSRPCSNSDPLYHSFTSALVLSTLLPAYNILRPLPFWNHLLALHSRDHPTPVAPNIKCFQRIVYMSSPPDHNLLTCSLLLPLYFVANLTTTNSLLAAKLKWKLLLSVQHLSLWPSCLFFEALSFVDLHCCFIMVFPLSILFITHEALPRHDSLSEYLYSYDFNRALADFFLKVRE